MAQREPVAHGSRRDVLGCILVALLGHTVPGSARAAAGSIELAFDATSLDEALAAMGGVLPDSPLIVLTVPEAVENGAMVPVTVESGLPDTREIAIVVDSNPNPMVVSFALPEGTEPFVATRLKMAESGKVYAIVRAGGRLHACSRTTLVRLSGCA